jgi:hypothetical protein
MRPSSSMGHRPRPLGDPQVEDPITDSIQPGRRLQLDAEDIKKIEGMDKKMRFNDPSGNFGWNFYADLDGKK